MSGEELLRLPRVWEAIGVQCRVAEHFLVDGVVKRVVNGGIDCIVSRGGEGLTNGGWVSRATRHGWEGGGTVQWGPWGKQWASKL